MMYNMNKVSLSIVIVTMNSMKTLPALFKSFIDENIPAISHETIVVDNCSTDGTWEYISTNYKNIKLIRNIEIKGFAENNNIGMKYASGKYIAIINPDIIFMPESIDLILSFMKVHPDIGILGPCLLNKDGSIQKSARKFINIKTVFLRLITFANDNSKNAHLLNYLSPYDNCIPAQEVDWVIGAAMFVKKEALSIVGVFDERFFLYIEDQDWCFQMWKNNWKVCYYTEPKLIHDHQRSSVKKFNKKTFWHLKSMLYFLYKNNLFFSKGN